MRAAGAANSAATSIARPMIPGLAPMDHCALMRSRTLPLIGCSSSLFHRAFAHSAVFQWTSSKRTASVGLCAMCFAIWRAWNRPFSMNQRLVR